jgi:hypothetical protein
MRPSPSFLLRGFLCVSLSPYIFVGSAFAQHPVVEPRITRAVDDAHLTLLRGNTHPLALARYDRGPAPPSLPMDRMLLVLKRSPEQDAALLRLLDEQQDKSSLNYHKWLTPEQFGKQFGPADSDTLAVTSWLQTHGFQIGKVSKGRTVIEFSGTAAMVQEAFHTEIHKYVVGAESHWANASDPQIPSALTPVVAGVWTLHNFLKKPNLVMAKEHFPLVDVPGSAKPLATSSSGHHFLSPGDFALIYGINPVYQAGFQGNNVTIAVVGRSDIQLNDVLTFRAIFGLPGLNLQPFINGPDPGDLLGDEEAEAVLDTTWSGAVAQNALVDFVISASTDTTDGIDLSELYIVDNNLGDVMTESFGICEAHVTSAQLTGVSALAEQAAAQGITYLVSSGDTGSAGCDNLGETTANGPVSVNALASTPFNVAVGGTIFNENGHDSAYWSSNTSVPVTALKYIPENVWNESCTTCSNPSIAAGGGGASAVVPKPFWQSGLSSIPQDGFRDVPDVSLTSAIHDPYLLCLAGTCNQGFLVGIGGTSAAAPSFAGIIALIDQKEGGRVGLANYVLYKLAAAESLAQCNASGTATSPASTCVFNDVTVGNNAVPGEASFTTSPQFKSGVGYDLATGLGSVQVNNLVNQWSSVTFKPSMTNLTLSPLTGITHGSPVTVSITVAPPPGGTGTPTGDVTLLANASTTSTGGQSVDKFVLAGGTVATTTHLLPGGTNTMSAYYAGDTTFVPSASAATQVTVSAEPSAATVKALTADSTGQPVPFASGPYGSFVYLRADVAGKSGFGTPTGGVSFFDNTGFLTSQNLNSQGNTNTPNGILTLAPGPHAITATYQGDVSFLPSNPSPPVNFSITKAATTTTVQASPSLVASGSPTTLTAVVDTTSGGNAPSGTVLFFNGVTQLPGNSFLSSGVNSKTGFAQSTATYPATTLPNGQDSITAQYTADPNYTGSASPAITVTVAPDFALAFTGTTGNTMTIAAPGGSGSLTLTVTGQTGYNGTVSFSGAACLGLPLGASCSFSPASVTGSGMTTLTVRTIASHSRLAPGGTTILNAWAATGGLTLAGVFLLGFAPRKRRWASLFGLLMLAWLMTIAGCGGGGGGGGGGTTGTIPGSYPVTVTGADANFSHPVSFTLNVQ